MMDGAESAANARIGARYDELPYDSRPSRRSHPAHIAMIAQLLGLTPSPPMRANILEIGCASGAHIIPLAAQYPDARFVGVDLSAAQIATGLARIERHGLRNIELIRGDLVEFSPGRETFDYILCHGVYSWVPIEFARGHPAADRREPFARRDRLRQLQRAAGVASQAGAA